MLSSKGHCVGSRDADAERNRKKAGGESKDRKSRNFEEFGRHTELKAMFTLI